VKYTYACQGDYETASPCDPVDLPQTLLEPILVRYATLNGFSCRFDTNFINFVQDDEGATSTLCDNLTGVEYKIRSKYLFGADGARGEVFRQLDLPLDVQPEQGLAFNVHLKADLSKYMQYRRGNLHWLLQPDREHPLFGWACIARMVKPWDEWLFIVLPERGKELEVNPTNEEWLDRMKEFIGDDSIDTEILGVSKWRINDVVAESFSKGRVYAYFLLRSDRLVANIYAASVLVMRCTDTHLRMDLVPILVYKMRTTWLGRSRTF
jgi:2-polyprenyl-6-methoxyphenol hydroxylase-like FAD-dependent oxidoreductase